MLFQSRPRRRLGSTIAGLAGLIALSAAQPAWSQAPNAAAAPASTNAMVNLIQLLVRQGTITQANGDALLGQAQADARKASADAAQASANAGLPPAPAGTIRVPYVPASVREQISEEVRNEVMARAKDEGWASPEQAAPAWLHGVTLSGDIRIRSESDFYARNNSNQIINFASINSGGPFNFNANPLVLPFVNATQDRTNQLKLRARLGIDANISSFARASFRLASGNDNGPISTNDSLGGGFGKRNIWLDRAYLTVTPTKWASASFGRMPNPFRSTDLLYDVDLNFDGAVITIDGKPWLGDRSYVRAHVGAFPLDYGSANFPNTLQQKRGYPEKWLYSAQIDAGTKVGNVDVSASAAYHDFHNVQGQLSNGCAIYAGAQECSTDGTRPFFLRQGNTLFPIRNIAVDPNLPANSIQPNPQYLGLAFKYRVLDVNATVSIPLNDKLRAGIDGDYLRNLAFHRRDLCRYAPLGEPVNNIGTVNGSADPCGGQGRYEGGNQGFMVRASVGYPDPKRKGEWSVTAGYRYLQSDATLDSFTDSDFHLGGTNSKGYTIAGTIGVLDGINLTGRWLSANEIVGEPLAIDVLQIDLSAAF